MPAGAVGVERIPGDLVLPPEEALVEAQRLLDDGLPFHAHEILEGVWKAAPGDERELWQGLAQLAVGVTHAARGNTAGAVRLLRRGAGRLHEETGRRHGVDVPGLTRWVDETARVLETRPPGPVRVAVPRLALST